MNYFIKPYRHLIISLTIASQLSACGLLSNEQTELEKAKQQKVKTLGALVSEQGLGPNASTSLIDEQFKQQLSKKERTIKLAKIYQNMLTLEPNANIRAQIQHRLVNINVEQHEQAETLENPEVIAALVSDYQQLLTTYPDRIENENILYQLAKNYALQGDQKSSLSAIEHLISHYPNTEYYAELQFRRAEIYYSLQYYSKALEAYEAVLSANNNEKYQLNSLYMAGWCLFKANQLQAANEHFLRVLIIASERYVTEQEIFTETITEQQIIREQENTPLNYANFSFEQTPNAVKSLALDAKRILSISLSQQEQAKSLVELLSQATNKANITKESLALFSHLLFDDLANFLLDKGLHHDAVLTYQAYLTYQPNNIWSARYSLTLLDLYKSKNQFSKIYQLKQSYVLQYGLSSNFWRNSPVNQRTEILPNLLFFSLEHSRRLYAKAQDVDDDLDRKEAFLITTQWLKRYLDLTQFQLGDADSSISYEQYLYAEASFEAQFYQQALTTYEFLAYKAELKIALEPELKSNLSINDVEQPISPTEIQLNAAYATTYVSRAIVDELDVEFSGEASNKTNTSVYRQAKSQQLIFDKLFVKHYGKDKRAKDIAVYIAQTAFTEKKIEDVLFYADYILNAYQLLTAEIQANSKNTIDNKTVDKTLSVNDITNKDRKRFSRRELKHINIVSQLKANVRYQQKQYALAEKDYLFALPFEQQKAKQKQIQELIAACIYQQGKANINNIELAVGHFLRLGQVVPNSPYRINAEFDAANLYLENKQWQKSVTLLTQFERNFPKHQYTKTIPAKLAMAYEQLLLWPKAAQQLQKMLVQESDLEVKREIQYTIAEYYLKSDDLTNAIVHFRNYAHQYPEPFAIAQEVRFKMSEFYKQTKEPNKRYFWYRKLIKFHQQQLKRANTLLDAELSRSQYLASNAAFLLGQAHQQTFNWIKLKAPLNVSLKRKQTSMKEALKYYQLVFDWQFVEFVPQANYSIAQMYQKLADDVMLSERPNDLDELALEEYEFLLEEIAYPFEEKSIEIHQANAERSWLDVYDQWIEKSFAALAEIEPAKYKKFEAVEEAADEIF